MTQSPKIIAKIRQERNKLYQTELATTAVSTLKDVMTDKEAPASARVSAARTAFELAGDIGKHSQANRNEIKNLAEMSTTELAGIIDALDAEKMKLAKDISPNDNKAEPQALQAELIN